MILVDTSVWIEVFRSRQPLVLGSFVDFDDVPEPADHDLQDDGVQFSLVASF